MVYFNCAKCGTGLKKAQVEQHMFQCRSRLVSCIDCQKDFKDAEFKGHLTCMTESERYESKDYVAKANKGDLKQTAWIEKISQAVSVFRGSAKAKSMLEKLVEYPNVPRKKPKFINFVRNSFRYLGASDAQIEEIWTVIEAFDKKTPPPPPKPQNQQTTPEKPTDTNTSPPQKRKLDDCNDDNNNLTPEFDWLEEIKRICLKKDSNTIDLEKLEKKLYKRYKKHKNGGADENRCESSTNGHSTETKNVENDDNDENEEKFKKKLNKKLKKLNNSDSSSISLISNHNGDQSIMVVVKYLNNNNSNSNDE